MEEKRFLKNAAQYFTIKDITLIQEVEKNDRNKSKSRRIR